MYHELPRSARFWSVLLAIDQDLAENTRKNACPCGGRLHSANYLRKPRGTARPASRATAPPTELLLRSRRLQEESHTAVGALPRAERSISASSSSSISAMRQGPSPRRVRELSARFGADESTIARWQTFWREHFPQTPFWKIARASLVPLVEIVSLPYSLVDAFLGRHPPLPGLDTPAAVSLANHGSRGPANQGLAMIAPDPQKMLFAHAS